MCLTFNERYPYGHHVFLFMDRCDFKIAIGKLNASEDSSEVTSLEDECKKVSEQRPLLLDKKCDECSAVPEERTLEELREELEAKVEKWGSECDVEE
jgi:hypothetical protein